MSQLQHSAEKDLLRLIENPGEAEQKKTELAAAQDEKTVKKIALFSFARRKRNSGAKKKFSLAAALTDRKLILRILFVVTVCLFIYLIVTVAGEYSKSKNTKNMTKFSFHSEGKEIKMIDGASVVSGEAEHPAGKESFNIRNIFKQDSGKKEEEKKDDVAAALADYRLVGISQSADPSEMYAMIKNAKTNITFFLKKGEKLEGMELVNIAENKVMLRVKGKEVELR